MSKLTAGKWPTDFSPPSVQRSRQKAQVRSGKSFKGRLDDCVETLDGAMSEFDNELLSSDTKVIKGKYGNDFLMENLMLFIKHIPAIQSIANHHKRCQDTLALNKDVEGKGSP